MSEEKENISEAQGLCTELSNTLKAEQHSGICIVLDKERMHFSLVKMGAGAAIDVLDSVRKQILIQLANEQNRPS